MEAVVQFTEAEHKIRRRALFWLLKLPATLIAFVLILSLIGGFNREGVAGIILSTPLLFALFYLHYYCSYKNRGTKLLSLALILMILNLPFQLLEFVTLTSQPLFLALFASSILFQIILLYYTYKLRKVNKRFQEREIISSSIYKGAITFFSTTSSLKELKQKFRELKSPNDSGATLKILKKAYKDQKKVLKI